MNISDCVQYTPLTPLLDGEAAILRMIANALPQFPTEGAPQRTAAIVALVHMTTILAYAMAEGQSTREELGCIQVVLSTYAKSEGIDLNAAAVDADAQTKAGTN